MFPQYKRVDAVWTAAAFGFKIVAAACGNAARGMDDEALFVHNTHKSAVHAPIWVVCFVSKPVLNANAVFVVATVWK